MSKNDQNTTMRAVAYRTSLPIDDAESLLDVELPVPQPGPRDLLVRVEAIAVNPVDSKVRQGHAIAVKIRQGQAITVNPVDDTARQGVDPAGELKVLGWDAAGTVVAVGDEVELFNVGDEVYYAGALDRSGTNSRFHVVDERIVGHKPATLSFTEAAALPMTALTAWEGLFDRMGLRNAAMEQHGALLVIAAAGGVGSIAVQLARALTSLTVIGTASRPETTEWVRRMGAHHVINHRQPLAQQLADVAPGGVDYIFSMAATAQNITAYAEVLNPFGHIVSIDDLVSLDIGVLKSKSISFHWEFMYTRSLFQTADQQMQHHILTQVARLVDAGTLTTTAREDLGPINAANLRRAHHIMESGTAIGKITLTGF